MPSFAVIKKIGIQYNDMQKKNNKIYEIIYYNVIKTYSLQEDGCSASVTFGKVVTALSFSTQWGSLNCFSFLKPKF